MPTLLVVSGLPCTGKSTLAARVSNERGWPLLAKDGYKEHIFARLGWHDRAYSRQVSLLAWDLLFAAAADLLQAGACCVLEGNFRAAQVPRLRALAALPAVRLVEIACTAAPALILARLELRVQDGSRHPGHLDHELHAELAAEVEQGDSGALGLDAAVLRYDSGAPECTAALLARLAARLDAPA
jgi:predicted kinase